MRQRPDGEQGGTGRSRSGGSAAATPPAQDEQLDPDTLMSGASADSLAGQVASFRAGLPTAEGLTGLTDQDRLDLLREMELLTRTMGAVAARAQVGFYTSQVARQLADGVPARRAGRAAPDDLAGARMTSPYWGSRDLTCAKALCTELPQTLQALSDGVIDSYQARIIAEATTTLDPEDRAEVDQRLRVRLPGASSKEIGAAVRALVYEVDPAGFVNRARKAAKDRGLSLRPCPDVMGLLSARLPAPQALAVYSALRSAAVAKQASGDPRTLNQLMVDELYGRVTGRAVVDGVDVEVGLVITDTALLLGTSEAAELTGYGPIPAELARELLRPDPAAPQEGSDDDGGGAPGRTPTGDGDSPTGDEAHEDIVARARTDEDIIARGRTDEDIIARGRTDEDIIARARADAAANSNGFPGGQAPPGHCPDGGRCTDFSCTLVHGHPAPTAMPSSPVMPPAPEQARATPAPEDREHLPDATGPPPEDSAPARAAKVWLRRLLTDPVTGVLTHRDPRRRLFTGAVRAFVIARDRTCRNSWCGAPIRHVDHVIRHRDLGPTQDDNGRGQCARCNLARERPRHTTTDSCRPPPPLLDGLPRPRAAEDPASGAAEPGGP